MLIGLLGAFVAAIAYGGATILQAIGVRRLRETSTPAAFFTRLRAGWPYVTGLGLDALGFLASVGALRSLPLFLVQSVIASSVAVTALLAVLVLGARLDRREVAALAVVALGLCALAASAEDGPARGVPHGLGLALLVAGALVGAATCIGVRRRSSSLLALCAGLAFAGLAVGARILVWDGHPLHALASPALWAILVHAAVATIAYGFALDAGAVTSVAAITFAVETVVPALTGLALLGDEVRPHTTALAIAGFVLTLGACLALAGRSEPDA